MAKKDGAAYTTVFGWGRLLLRRSVHIVYVTFSTLFRHLSRTTIFHAFHYTGRSDENSCFHCNVGLRDWLSSDNPFEEHARWAPACVFLNFVKGPEYVRERRRIAQRDGRGDIYSAALNEN